MAQPLTNRANPEDWRSELERLLELSRFDRASRYPSLRNVAGSAATGGDAVRPPLPSSPEPTNGTHGDSTETAAVRSYAACRNGDSQEPSPIEEATRRRAWRLKASALALVSVAVAGAFFALSEITPKPWNGPAFIGVANSQATSLPTRDEALAASSDADAPFMKDDAQTAAVGLVNSEEPRVEPLAQPSLDSVPARVSVPAPVGAPDLVIETSSATPVTLRPGPTPIAAPVSSIATSNEASLESKTPLPPIESVSLTTDRTGQTLRPSLASPEPQMKPSMLGVVVKPDATTLRNGAAPLSRLGPRRMRAKHEKAAKRRSAALAAVDPHEPPAASAPAAQEPTEAQKGAFPLFGALGDQLRGTAARAQ